MTYRAENGPWVKYGMKCYFHPTTTGKPLGSYCQQSETFYLLSRYRSNVGTDKLPQGPIDSQGAFPAHNEDISSYQIGSIIDSELHPLLMMIRAI